jgi:hypothetical protein
MAQQMTSARSARFVNTNFSELQDANHSPIYGYKNEITMTLEEAVEKIDPFVNDSVKYVDEAKRKCNRNTNILTRDESAAIYLYTMPTFFFSCLNNILRAGNRYALKPWFAFLKLLISALEKLPSTVATVWRGVAGDVDTCYVEDDVKVWWSVNSSSTALNVVQLYLGERGTLFAIEAIHGKNISEYSAFPDEQEVIIMPGTCLRMGRGPLNFIDRLFIVHLKEDSTTEENIQGLVHVKDLIKSNMSPCL